MTPVHEGLNLSSLLVTPQPQIPRRSTYSVLLAHPGDRLIANHHPPHKLQPKLHLTPHIPRHKDPPPLGSRYLTKCVKDHLRRYNSCPPRCCVRQRSFALRNIPASRNARPPFVRPVIRESGGTFNLKQTLRALRHNIHARFSNKHRVLPLR
jgi:hypothetical protein